MTKMRALTEAQRVEEQRARVLNIINAAVRSAGYKTMKDFAGGLGWNYNTMMSRLNADGFSLRHFTAIADKLKLDDTTRAACCGSKTKCRWESGYKDGAA